MMKWWTITVMNQDQSWVMTHHNHPRSSMFSQYWHGSFFFRMVCCLKCQALKGPVVRGRIPINYILNHNLINRYKYKLVIPNEPGSIINHVYTPTTPGLHRQPGRLRSRLRSLRSLRSPKFLQWPRVPWIQLIIRTIISPIAPCTEIHGMTPESPQVTMHHAAPTAAPFLLQIEIYDHMLQKQSDIKNHITWLDAKTMG